MRGKVYVNGDIVDPAEARISVFDRGFLYGDSVFETLRVYGGQPFALAEHTARLFASGERVGLAIPWSADTLHGAIARTLQASGLADAYLRVIVTRGAGPLTLDPTVATSCNLVILAVQLPALPATLYTQGRTARLVARSGAAGRKVDPRAKTGNYLNAVLAVREARAHAAEEAILVDADGRVTEASSANVFVRLQGTWCTPPLEVGILSGITRSTILRLCREAGEPCEERAIAATDLPWAEEIFLCASVREIVPIVELDGQAVGAGGVGPTTRRMLERYRAEVARRLQGPS